MAKILFIRANDFINDSRVTKETESLLSRGHQVFGLGWKRISRNESKGTETIDNVTNYRLPGSYGGGFKNLKSLLHFQLIVFFHILKNKSKYDYVHCCDLDVGLPASLACRLIKKEYIYDIFDYYPDSRNLTGILYKLSIILEKFVINGARTTIICSEQRIKQIAGTSPKEIVVIHNSPPKYVYNVNEEILPESERFSIAYFGLLGEDRLVKELVDIVKSIPEIDLEIGGMGPLTPYVEGAASVCSNIHFWGRLEYKRVLELESKCSLMLATYDPKILNHRYAAPNKFYESLMLGKPVIMVKNTGVDQIISDNKFGIVIDKYDKELLQSAIGFIVSNYKFYEDKAIDMMRVYEENFSWSEMENRLARIYE